MELKDKIYELLKSNKFFNKTPLEISRLLAQIASNKKNKDESLKDIKTTDIPLVISELEKSGMIKIHNGLVRNNFPQLTGTFYANKYGAGKIVTMINNKVTEFSVSREQSLNAPNESVVTFVENNINDKKSAVITNVLNANQDKVFGTIKVLENDELAFFTYGHRFVTPLKVVDNEFARKAINMQCSAHISNQDLISANPNSVVEIKSADQIYGHIDNPQAYTKSLQEEFSVSPLFPESVTDTLDNIPDYVTEEDMVGLKDLRNKKIFKIDPATSKDADDAIGIEEIRKNGKLAGFKLYVAISDVTKYVKPGTELDKEAQKRGTSIYYAGTVAPMIPIKLSNGICSLNKGVDRLAFVTEIDLDLNGKITGYDIYESVINVKEAFSYEEASDLYHNKPDALDKFGKFKKEINLMYQLEKIMTNQAKLRGAITFSGYQPTIVLDSNKSKVVDFKNDNGVDSHKIIEIAMVLSNNVISQFMNKLEVVNMSRNHPVPKEEKVKKLVGHLNSLGINVAGRSVVELFQNVSSIAQEHILEKVINNVAIRAQEKAKYSADESSHFALGLDDYSHFTSPIRRYPDIVQHRILKATLANIQKIAKEKDIDIQNKKTSEIVPLMKPYVKSFVKLSDSQDLKNLAFHLNMCEEKAKSMSSLSEKMCAAAYMQNHIGKVFKGYVSYIDGNKIEATLFDEKDPLHSNVIAVTIHNELQEKIVNTAQGPLKVKQPNNKVYMLGQELEFKILSSDPFTKNIIASTDLTKEITVENNNYSKQQNEKTLVKSR